jgi:hypothetical protein
VHWKNLQHDAKQFPDVTALKDAAAAERELRTFLEHRDLIKIR